jgi:hypothetical protein
MLIRRTEKDAAQIIRDSRIAALSDSPRAFGAKFEDMLREAFGFTYYCSYFQKTKG